MLIGNDLESLQRLMGIQGLGDVPQKYVREYDIRKGLHDRDGDSGPMGTIALIDMLRFCGYEPPKRQEADPETNWDNVKIGTRVEMLVENAWKPGEFLGFGELKRLHLRLDHDPWIKECDKTTVRVAADQTKPVFEPVVEPPEVLPPAPLRPEEIPGVYAHEYADVTHWNKMPVGTELWVEIDNDIPTAKFLRMHHDQAQIIVEIDGEERTVSTSVVHVVEPAAA